MSRHVTKILERQPNFENDIERVWNISHYKVTQKKSKHGLFTNIFHVYDSESSYYNLTALAKFNSQFYLEQYLQLLMMKDVLIEA